MPDGWLALLVDYDAMFQRYLVRVQEDISLITEDQDVELQYSTNRTPCKKMVTPLEQAGFGDEFVDRMNRWRAQEQSMGRFV